MSASKIFKLFALIIITITLTVIVYEVVLSYEAIIGKNIIPPIPMYEK